MADSNVKIFNAVRARCSDRFQQNVNEATQGMLGRAFEQMTSDVNFRNEWMGVFINQVGKTIVRSKRWKNILAPLKHDWALMGDTIQEVGNAYIRSKGFDLDAQTLLKTNSPTSEVYYHREDRKDKYPISIHETELRRAFQNPEGLAEYLNSLMDIAFNSDERDEYDIMMQLLAEYDKVGGGFYKVQVPQILGGSEADIKQALVLVKGYVGDMQFPQTTYCRSKIAPTFTAPEDIVILMTPWTRAAIDVEALAGAFNLDKMEIKHRIIEVQSFPNPNTQMIVMDKNWYVCGDTVYETRTFDNPENLFHTYFLHHWGIYGASPFANAIMFTTEEVAEQEEPGIEVTSFEVKAVDESGAEVSEISLDGTYNIVGKLNGTADGDIEVKPNSFIYSITAKDAEGAPIQVTNKTGITRLGKLYMQKFNVGDVIIINAKSTYSNPDGPTPEGLEDTLELTVVE